MKINNFDLSKVVKLNVLELEHVRLVSKHNSSSGDGHVLQRVLSVVSESGSLDGGNLEANLNIF